LEARARAVAVDLAAVSHRPADVTLELLGVSRKGLTDEKSVQRRHQFGPNIIAQERAVHWGIHLLRSFWNPFILVLVCLAGVMSLQAPGDPGVVILTTMVAVSGLLRFWQESRSGRSARALTALVTTTTAVQRRAFRHSTPKTVEVPLEDVVPGDIVHLAAGDLVPADLRLLSAKDLMVSQAALSGESLPVAKADTREGARGQVETSDPVEANNLCLMGTSVTSGTGTGVVVATGSDTYFGSMAGSLSALRPETTFDVGVREVSFLLIRFMLVMVPVVFVINGLTKNNWSEAFMFAVAVAVGLTPEMLPMVVTTNLARGAVGMAKRKVVVKRLNSIQDLGSMDVLCTDKTGTLTEDRIVLNRCLDVYGFEDDAVLQYAYLNSHFQSGLRNLLDKAVVDRVHEGERIVLDAAFTKVDEIPFDFARRRMSVILGRGALVGCTEEDEHVLICKGAVEEVLELCAWMKDGERTVALTEELRRQVADTAEEHNRQGLRVLAVATRIFPGDRDTYGMRDETHLALVGFLTFLDPPKLDAAAALRGLAELGITVKVVTGDSELVAARVCADVGIPGGRVVSGSMVDDMDDSQLRTCVADHTVFAKANPMQKARIVRALQSAGHTVGFLGDGINDAAALRESDVGISVDTAVDIAKESADIILLEKDLTVLEQGVLQGRTTFGNTIKYIKMTASSNFGNVFSVLVASTLIPFQPMLAIHLLVQNLAYDISQLATPWDRMDPEYLRKPRNWDPSGIGRFMLLIGPISSIFDITTFLLMWHVFGANSAAHQSLFQSGWFIEGLLSQTLIVHMIRTRKIPFIQSRASLPVLIMTGAVMAFGIFLPFSPFASYVALQSLPLSYFPWLIATLLAYCALTQLVKTWYISRFQTWL
jgi:Mg2+-importing ATPase